MAVQTQLMSPILLLIINWYPTYSNPNIPYAVLFSPPLYFLSLSFLLCFAFNFVSHEVVCTGALLPSTLIPRAEMQTNTPTSLVKLYHSESPLSFYYNISNWILLHIPVKMSVPLLYGKLSLGFLYPEKRWFICSSFALGHHKFYLVQKLII